MAPTGVVNWHIGRCGSSVLGSLLAQHPDVGYSNEIFSPFMPRRRGERLLPSLEQVVQSAARDIQTPIHLFEVKHLRAQNLGLYPQLRLENWLSRFDALGYRHHLLMFRRNGLRRMVSHVRAEQTGLYVAAADTKMPSAAVTLPLDAITHGFERRSLLDWLEIYEHGHAKMRDAFSQRQDHWLELVYEDDIEASPLQAYQRVCDFLGLARVETVLRHRKMNPGPLCDLIANYTAVEACLKPTRFAWMLDA